MAAGVLARVTVSCRLCVELHFRFLCVPGTRTGGSRKASLAFRARCSPRRSLEIEGSPRRLYDRDDAPVTKRDVLLLTNVFYARCESEASIYLSFSCGDSHECAAEMHLQEGLRNQHIVTLIGGSCGVHRLLCMLIPRVIESITESVRHAVNLSF